MRVTIIVDKCTGCRKCELACSFHHKKVFAPEFSSIKVSRNNRTGEIRLAIGSTCDLCWNEDQIQCVKSCRFGALEEVG